MDTSVIVDAKDAYPIRHFPRYWDWLIEESQNGLLKIPKSQWDEIRDPELNDWKKRGKSTLLISVGHACLQRVINCYCPNPTAAELQRCQNDAELIATAAENKGIVVSSERSSTTKQRANQMIPDICAKLGVACLSPTKYYREKGYSFFE